ncbi:MAG: hypothetical protein WD847_02810 [Pirellulales bacterium]
MLTANLTTMIPLPRTPLKAPPPAARLALRAAQAVLLMPLCLLLLPLLPCVLCMHAVKKLHDWQECPCQAGRPVA